MHRAVTLIQLDHFRFDTSYNYGLDRLHALFTISITEYLMMIEVQRRSTYLLIHSFNALESSIANSIVILVHTKKTILTRNILYTLSLRCAQKIFRARLCKLCKFVWMNLTNICLPLLTNGYIYYEKYL